VENYGQLVEPSFCLRLFKKTLGIVLLKMAMKFFVVWIITFSLSLAATPLTIFTNANEPSDWRDFPAGVRTVLKNSKPLSNSLGDRMPLYLWAVHDGMVDDDALQRRIVSALETRGVAMISTWNTNARDKSLEQSLRIARIQKNLGLPVSVNATSCMYSFFNGDPSTAHIDRQGKPFFDDSISGGKIGCPFRLSKRIQPMRDQIAPFVAAYKEAGLPLDLVFGDWEIDGPLDVNRAWEASQKCKVCCAMINNIDQYNEFQKTVRIKRSELTRKCYSEPILDHFPTALVGNYGVYANDGYRYWYDYFERFELSVPHRLDQRAPYRTWYQVYPLTGYTMAMPVVYPWVRTYHWYDYRNPEYRWFYNMLLVASNAGKSSSEETPLVPFVHWHTVFAPDEDDKSVQAMSRWAYQELLWHMLLRRASTFFLWCTASEAPVEIELVHKVWSDSLEHKEFLTYGKPFSFQVPETENEPVVSGLIRGNQALVRRTDFSKESVGAVEIKIGKQTLTVPRKDGLNQVIELNF
jgi:hypothetical protein